MKIVTTLFLTACLSLSACDRHPRTASAASEQALKAARDQYQDYVQGRLKEFAYRFDGLEARKRGLGKADQEELKLDISELRDRRGVLEKRYDDMKGVSDESWPDLKSSLDRELDDLEVAYNIVAANNHGANHEP